MSQRIHLGRALALCLAIGLAGGCDTATDDGTKTGTGGGPGVTIDAGSGGTDASIAADAVTTADVTPDVPEAQPDASADPDVATPEDVSGVSPLALVFYEPKPEELAAYPQCTADDLTLTVYGNKVAALELGNGGYDGEGLDVDGSALTCAPADDCSDGVDNQLGTLGAIVNGSLVDSLDSGVIMLALSFEGFATGGVGEPFTLKMFTVRIDPSDEDCDWQKDECLYDVRADSFDEDCHPLMMFDNAVIAESGAFTAGGPEAQFILSVPLFGLTVQVPVYKARIEAMAVTEAGLVHGVEGIIGGAVPKVKLMDAIDVIPDEEFAATGYNKDFIKNTLGSIVEDDIDTDGDGTGDAASIGIRFKAIPGKLVGLEIPASP